MLCPKCEKEKLAVIDTVKNQDDNEIYRRRRCKNCGHEVFTVEKTTTSTFDFFDKWFSHHRWRDKKKHSQKIDI